MSTKVPDKVPRVGVGCIIVRSGKLLLVRDRCGFWSPPGGHLAFGESPDVCAAREIFEETSLRISNVEFVAITNDVLTDVNQHYLMVWMRGETDNSPVRIGDKEEISEIGWFLPDDLPKPLDLVFLNLITGRGWPRSPANLPLTLHCSGSL